MSKVSVSARSADPVPWWRKWTRKTVYDRAWILFWIGILCPVPGVHGFWGTISGLSVIGRVIEWGMKLPTPLDVRHGVALFVLVLGLFSNIFWLTRVNLDVDLSRGFRFLLVGCLANNVLVSFFFPEFLRLPGYWFWLLSWCGLCWSLVEMHGTVRAEENPTASAVPTLILVWLGFLVFWIGVTVVNRIAPASAVADDAVVERSKLTGYFNDESHLFQPGEKVRLDGVLSAFEKQTSNQIAVAVYPRVPSGSVEDFTLHTAERSRLGRKGLDNGAILFIFMGERVARLEVGYGLEGALPDITAVHILDQELGPRFSRGEYEAGLDASVAAILDTVRDEGRNARAPGILTVAWQQVAAAARRIRREAWPILRQTNAGARIGISLFGSLLGIGVWSGLANGARLVYALARGLWNVIRRRPFGTEIRQVSFSPMWDTLKLGVFLAIVIGGVVVIAGGGGFGGAGALIRW